MNVLLSIGVDAYGSLGRLTGAEADARAIFDTLTATIDTYDSASSVLLLSPCLADVQATLQRLFPLRTNIEGFTFFFAGHGAVVGTNFYLCLRDTDDSKFSTTAFAINHFLLSSTSLLLHG